MVNNKKVAIYCRVARSDQTAIERQKTVLQGFAEEQGYTNSVCYMDNGFSGFDYMRTALLQMQSDISKGQIEAVIVHDIARIGRSYTHTLEWMHWLGKQGVELIIYDQVMAQTA